MTHEPEHYDDGPGRRGWKIGEPMTPGEIYVREPGSPRPECAVEIPGGRMSVEQFRVFVEDARAILATYDAAPQPEPVEDPWAAFQREERERAEREERWAAEDGHH